jgi:hypothetical protein
MIPRAKGEGRGKLLRKVWRNRRDKIGENRKNFKPKNSSNISNLRIVSMIPGDRKVAG